MLEKKNIKYYSCIKKLNIDNSKLHFLQTKEYDNENDNSNVIYTKLDGYKFMFMGDAGVEKEKEILKAQVINEGRPENIAEKIVMGRLGKFYGEICLLDQEFVKDPNKKVGQMVTEKNGKVIKFARFEKGEGIEKKEENFAEEVAKQLQ